jgi:hypothetical protein
MVRMIAITKRLILGAAFVGVMAGTGGLAGGIGGVLMVLLGRTVLGVANDLAVLMSAGSGAGALAAAGLGIFLMLRPSQPLALQPSVATTPVSVSTGAGDAQQA